MREIAVPTSGPASPQPSTACASMLSTSIALSDRVVFWLMGCTFVVLDSRSQSIIQNLAALARNHFSSVQLAVEVCSSSNPRESRLAQRRELRHVVQIGHSQHANEFCGKSTAPRGCNRLSAQYVEQCSNNWTIGRLRKPETKSVRGQIPEPNVRRSQASVQHRVHEQLRRVARRRQFVRRDCAPARLLKIPYVQCLWYCLERSAFRGGLRRVEYSVHTRGEPMTRLENGDVLLSCQLSPDNFARV